MLFAPKMRAPNGSADKQVTGERLTQYLKDNGLTMYAAAKKCGIPATTLQYYCAGKRRPSAKAMEKLRAIGITDRDLFGHLAADLAARERRDAELLEQFHKMPPEIQEDILHGLRVAFGGSS